MVIETYYRKRPKKPHQPRMEMDQCRQQEAVQGSVATAELPRWTPLLHDGQFLIPDEGDEPQMPNNIIKEGYFYKIDHAQLPPRTPTQLRSIRVAMVCEKTEMNVAVRFPSMESLRAYFNYSSRESHPALDEKFVMGSVLAARALVRVVPADVFTEQKSWIAFWLIGSCHVGNRKGSGYLSEALKGSGMVTWGIRRQVKYLGKHKENDDSDVYNAQNSSSSLVNGVEGLIPNCDDGESAEEADGGERDEDMENDDDQENAEEEEEEEEEQDVEEEEEEDEEEEEEEEEDEEEVKIKVEANENLKRKRYSFRNLSVRKTKKPKVEIKKQKQKQKQNKTQKKNQIKKKKGSKRSRESLIHRDPKDRWSAERYKLAEQNLLEVMKSKGATAEKPILRPQLRAEARKRIGDTGLLDHLLKHMAGKLAPGGKERFRRRHNPDGAMEYWLENANLVNIRRDAGVTDPYWVPPAGWKPGDSPTQDPICARELKLLRHDVSKIKRSLEMMATRMELEEEVEMLRREMDEISSTKKQQENKIISVESNRCDISQKLDQLAASFESSKRDFGYVHVPVEQYKEQFMAISGFVKDIEGKFEKLAHNVTEAAQAGSPLMVAADAHMMRKEVEREKKQQVQDALISAAEGRAFKLEEKAAKIERLKSGFRICKPQGTFLWPNMVKESNSSSNIDNSDSFLQVQVKVPTPPSVSSSTMPPQLPYGSSGHYHYQIPPSPSIVKPLAEKRAVTVTVSTTNTPASLILNDSPVDDIMPPYKVAANRLEWESSGTACDEKTATKAVISEVGSWLALSTPKSASEDSSSG